MSNKKLFRLIVALICLSYSDGLNYGADLLGDRAQGVGQCLTFAISTDSDAQKLVDARQLEVANNDVALAQQLGQFGCITLWMAGENEVRG